MVTLEIGERFKDRLKPTIVWCVVGILDAEEGRFALLLSTDATSFCEVSTSALLEGERFTRVRTDG
ncbi:MAG: hypothetical protein AAGD34_10895 [Pseudomonadota bacterium]